jgi:hypothetical protein
MAGRLKFVLASASPRRLALLGQIGVEPDRVMPATIDETPKKNELPRNLARRLSQEKLSAAMDLAKDDPELVGALMLAADTIVSVGADRGGGGLSSPALRALAPRIYRPRIRQRQRSNPAPPGRDSRALQATLA